jgi:hypothetical protein
MTSRASGHLNCFQCYAAVMQYQTLRSVSDSHVFVVCYDGRFDELPAHVRHQGPWQGQHRGEIEKLKANYRRALARDGYALVKCEEAVFKPEA